MVKIKSFLGNKNKIIIRDQLGRCMAEFMNGKLKFSQMSRLQRIGCIKELRTMMESRMGELLKAELESSLNGIEAG